MLTSDPVMNFSRVIFALLLGALAGPALAAPAEVPHARVELLSANAAVAPGDTLLVGLRIEHEPGWHTYWKNPGDSGMPTRIQWTLPEGWSAGPILWPAPRRIRVGPLANFGYEDTVVLPVELTVPRHWKQPRAALTAHAEWLICKEVCLPGGVTLSLDLPAGRSSQDSAAAATLQAARDAAPRAPRGWRLEAKASNSHVLLRMIPVFPSAPVLSSAEFFPDQPDLIDNAAPQILARADDGAWSLALTAAPGFRADLPRLGGILVVSPGLSPDGTGQAATVDVPWPGGAPAARAKPPDAPLDASAIAAAANGPANDLGLAMALAFAFLGGLVLNLMPCVFPVVSIKVLNFARDAHGSAARLRTQGLAFASGILLSFWVLAGLLLALRAGGQALGWGYQLQSPPLVAGLATLFFLLGLNLSGVFEWGTRLQSTASSVDHGGGPLGAFFGGLLATLVATPCTAPFMGAALGFALTRPAIQSLLVFTALALGMGAPYVLLAFRPGWLSRLPRPGRWMETLKQMLAFPLYLTVVWLCWVLSEQLGSGAGARLMAGLVLLAAAAWLWQRFAVQGRSRAVRQAGVAGALALAALGAFYGAPTQEPPAQTMPAQEGPWLPWSDAALAEELSAGRPVFVDFTAAWCVTCQVNKRLVLESEPVRRAFVAHNVALLRADWTRRDEAITAALAKLGRSGVPVYALYRPGESLPQLLPEVLSPGLVTDALERGAADR
jgi:thiol:disulfide interchange protein/DsbC/DsbD-like thiol-disulfide interchange protein